MNGIGRFGGSAIAVGAVAFDATSRELFMLAFFGWGVNKVLSVSLKDFVWGFEGTELTKLVSLFKYSRAKKCTSTDAISA